MWCSSSSHSIVNSLYVPGVLSNVNGYISSSVDWSVNFSLSNLLTNRLPISLLVIYLKVMDVRLDQVTLHCETGKSTSQESDLK